MLLLNIYVRFFSVEGHQGQAFVIALIFSLRRVHIYLQQYKVPSFLGITACLIWQEITSLGPESNLHCVTLDMCVKAQLVICTREVEMLTHGSKVRMNSSLTNLLSI